jgi:mono/diheme cytochrome c family protein
MGALTSAELVPFLAHPNGWHRITAQQRIVERGDISVAPAVREILTSSEDERARLHAIWTLEGIAGVDAESLNRALADPSPHVRAAALRISEEWLPARSEAILPAVLALIEDEDPIVRAQLAAALGELPTPEGEEALAQLIRRHGDDPLIPDLAVTGLHGRESGFLQRLLSIPAGELTESSVGPTLRVLASAVFRAGDPGEVERLIGWAVQPSRPEWQRVALLTPRPNPGGRGGGPGGGIQLSSAPRGLIDLAECGSGQLGQGARSIAAIVNWPGKPRPVNANTVQPLNPEQMERFVAGELVFRTVCAACHGSEGEGVPGAGKPLVGSPWVVTRPIEVMRILLHGKEGDVEMPALGSSLDDAAIASVLTYIRRSWGHEASAVNPGQVTEVRGATTGRNRPYTEDELRAAR